MSMGAAGIRPAATPTSSLSTVLGIGRSGGSGGDGGRQDHASTRRSGRASPTFTPRRSSAPTFRLTSGWMIFLCLLVLLLCVVAVSIESAGFLNGLPLHISQVDPHTGSIFGGPELSRFTRGPLRAVGKGQMPKSGGSVKSSSWSMRPPDRGHQSMTPQQSQQPKKNWSTAGTGLIRIGSWTDNGGGRNGSGGTQRSSSATAADAAPSWSESFGMRSNGSVDSGSDTTSTTTTTTTTTTSSGSSTTTRVGRRRSTPPMTLREACEAEVRQFCQGEGNHLRCLLSLKGQQPPPRTSTTTRGSSGRGGLQHAAPSPYPPLSFSSPSSSSFSQEEREGVSSGSNGGDSGHRSNNTHHHLFSPSCEDWLGARESCMLFLQDHMRHQHMHQEAASAAFHCSLSESARNCLRQVPSALLPQRCRDSDYYRATMMNARAVKGWRSSF